MVRRRHSATLFTCLLALIGASTFQSTALGSPVSPATRARLAQAQPASVIVEFDVTAADALAERERIHSNLTHDDARILEMRTAGYAAIRSKVASAISASDAVSTSDYKHLPLSVWRLNSLAALERLKGHASVRMVHENIQLHPVSVSDLPFINQPQTAAEGATGAGTAIAVIDGGLGTNYLNYSDFGTCTAVDTPPSTCRVMFNQDFYPGASTETVHGTNVSAIALGVAPGTVLAMYDVFNGSSASATDILTAIDSAISNQAKYNIVAINMSLGDGSSNSTPCTTSVFESAITNASSAGITTVVAAGNSGSKSGLADPACAPGAVSVGAVYDGSYGTDTWQAPAAPGGQCTDASAPDKVTCFSQSANYLTVLAPGTFVNAPNSSFQESGTSQATPHISGAVAVLRARYPAESLAETVQRLQISGVHDTDTGNNLTSPRLNLLAATNQGTSVSLSGSGPASATSGTNSTYSLTATNSGPLAATNVSVVDRLPPGATFVSASSGCTFSSGTVTCSAANLAVGSKLTFNIIVRWNFTGAVLGNASVKADQNDSAPAGQQVVAIGTVPDSRTGDAPLPVWAYVFLGLALFTVVTRRNRVQLQPSPGPAPRRGGG